MALVPGMFSCPIGVGCALAPESGVNEDYSSRLWAEISEEIADGKILDLRRTEGSSQSTNVTPTKPKRRRIVNCNLKNRTLAIRQLEEGLEDVHVCVSTEQLQR